MKNVWRWAWALTSLTALVGCDHATKYIAKAELEYHPPKELIRSVLDLRYVENTDVNTQFQSIGADNSHNFALS